MTIQRIEQAAAGLTIGGSAATWVLVALDWLSQNMSVVSAITLIGGFTLQCWASRRNKLRQDADERRAEAEEVRRQDEHELKMAILRGEMPDRRHGLAADVVGVIKGDVHDRRHEDQ